jgi:hypothetical protein
VNRNERNDTNKAMVDHTFIGRLVEKRRLVDLDALGRLCAVPAFMKLGASEWKTM